MVYPLIMLMQTMSAGGMGGGVAAAVARALGAGHRHDAHALVLHALLIACVMGALFTTVRGGPALYRAMARVMSSPQRWRIQTWCSPAPSASGSSTPWPASCVVRATCSSQRES